MAGELARRGLDQKMHLYPVDGGPARPLEGVDAGDWPARWSEDARYLYVYRRAEFPCRVFRLEVATGRKELWKEISPDPAGLLVVAPVLPSPDGSAYAFSYQRTLSELFVVSGVR